MSIPIAKLLRVENIKWMLGGPLKEASDKKVLNLLIVAVTGLTVEKTLAGKKGKASGVAKELWAIVNILHKEILGRMKNKTSR